MATAVTVNTTAIHGTRHVRTTRRCASPGVPESLKTGFLVERTRGRKALLPAPKKYPDELRERAVRLYRESEPKPSFRRLAGQLNVHPEALRNWVRQDEADRGERQDRPSTDMVTENQRLAAENAELRRVNEVLRAASAYFASEIGPTRR